MKWWCKYFRFLSLLAYFLLIWPFYKRSSSDSISKLVCPCFFDASIIFMNFSIWANLWGHRFSQNANRKLQWFLPYHTNKDRSNFLVVFLVSLGRFFGYDPCLFGREEILVIFGLHFGRNDDLINWFWILLTFSSNDLKLSLKLLAII